MTNIRMDPISDASVWHGDDLSQDRSWEFVLDGLHLEDLETALAAVGRQGLQLAEITAATFPLPTLSPMLARLTDTLKTGRGFAYLRGFPVHDYAYDDLERLYWGLCSHIGTGLTQNGDAGLIHYVTEGKLRPSQGKRGVGFPQRAPLHVDLMDVVSLLCVRQAADDPLSWVASSATVYNKILRRQPDALARLYEGFEWDRMDEHGPDETATSGYRVPVFSEAGGVVSCRYNRNWITTATVRKETPLSPAESAIFDLIDEIAYETRFEFPFHDGDIQFCNNYTAMHGREAHRVEAADDRKRVLMRIWLDVPDFRTFANDSLVRYGVGRHGQLGWTGADLLAGRNALRRARRADGTIAEPERV